MPTEKGPDTFELTDTEVCALKMAIEGSLHNDNASRSPLAISLRQLVYRLCSLSKIRDMLARLWRDPTILHVQGEDAKQMKESTTEEIQRLMKLVLESEADAKFACSHTVREHCDALIAVRCAFPDPGDTYVN